MFIACSCLHNVCYLHTLTAPIPVCFETNFYQQSIMFSSSSSALRYFSKYNFDTGLWLPEYMPFLADMLNNPLLYAFSHCLVMDTPKYYSTFLHSATSLFLSLQMHYSHTSERLNHFTLLLWCMITDQQSKFCLSRDTSKTPSE